VVEDAELTAEAAREVGMEAAAEALVLASDKTRCENHTSGMAAELRETKEALRSAELQLLE